MSGDEIKVAAWNLAKPLAIILLMLLGAMFLIDGYIERRILEEVRHTERSADSHFGAARRKLEKIEGLLNERQCK